MPAVSRAFLALILLWSLCALGQQPKALLPDPKLTPGDVFDVTVQDICVPGYAKKVRAVPRSLRNEAYGLYGITPSPGDYQLDHHIPLSLGGFERKRLAPTRLLVGFSAGLRLCSDTATSSSVRLGSPTASARRGRN